MINEEIVKRIKDSAKILDVFRYYDFSLKKNGSNYVTICPFHSEQHPSMTISPAKNICKCFSCGVEAMNPISFIMNYDNRSYPEALKVLADIYHIIIDESEPKSDEQAKKKEQEPKREPPKPKPEPKPDYTEESVMKATMSQYETNPLFLFVSSLFGEDKTRTAFLRYHVGTAKYIVNSNQCQRRCVVFWQTDENGNIRAGKLIPYNEQDGKRIKANPEVEKDKDVNWSHVAARNYKYNLHQCLYGQHLITPDVTRINIVESEKTAILASLYFGESKGVWLATGGKDLNASERRILDASNILLDRKVVLYPDADGFKEWTSLCGKLNDIGIKTTISASMKGQPSGTKYDIGDFIVSLLKNNDTTTPTITETPQISTAAPKVDNLPPKAQTAKLEPKEGEIRQYPYFERLVEADEPLRPNRTDLPVECPF